MLAANGPLARNGCMRELEMLLPREERLCLPCVEEWTDETWNKTARHITLHWKSAYNYPIFLDDMQASCLDLIDELKRISFGSEIIPPERRSAEHYGLDVNWSFIALSVGEIFVFPDIPKRLESTLEADVLLQWLNRSRVFSCSPLSGEDLNIALERLQYVLDKEYLDKGRALLKPQFTPLSLRFPKRKLSEVLESMARK